MKNTFYILYLSVCTLLGIAGFALASLGVVEFDGYIYLSVPYFYMASYVLRVFLLRKYFFDLTSIFLIAFIIFFSGRTIGFAVMGFDQFFVDSISQLTLPKTLMDVNASISLLSLSLILFSEMKFHKVFGAEFYLENIDTNSQWYKTGAYCFLVALPFMLIRMVYEYSHIQQVGYLSIYTQGLKGVEYPFPSVILTIAYYLFISGYYLIVASTPTFKRFLFFSCLFILVGLFDSLKGGRANVAIPFLFLVWWSFYRYNKQVSVYVALVASLVFATFFGVLGASRVDDSLGIALAGLSFLASQGNSPILMALRQIYSSEYEVYSTISIFSNLLIPYYYIFYPGIFDLPQSEEIVRVVGGFKHVLTFSVNSGYYLAGGGLGSSYLAELYELGIFGVIVGSILLGAGLSYFGSHFRGRAFGFFAFFIFTHFFLLPRAEFFPNLWAILKLGVTYIIFTHLATFSSRKRIFERKLK